MEWSIIGRAFLIFGAIFFVMGLIFLLFGRVPWLGRLPGDIFIQRGDFSFYFPLLTCLLISFVLTIVINLVIWLLSK